MKKEDIHDLNDVIDYLGTRLVDMGFQKKGNTLYYLINDILHKMYVGIKDEGLLNGKTQIQYYDISFCETKITNIHSFGHTLLRIDIIDFTFDNAPPGIKNIQIRLVDKFVEDIFKLEETRPYARKIKIDNIKKKTCTQNSTT